MPAPNSLAKLPPPVLRLALAVALMLVLIWLSVQLAAAMRSAAAAETCGVAGCHHSFRHGCVAGNWPGVNLCLQRLRARMWHGTAARPVEANRSQLSARAA